MTRPATFHAVIDAPFSRRQLVRARDRLAIAWRNCTDPDAAAFILTAHQYLHRAITCTSGHAREVYVARALEALRIAQR